MFVGAGKTIAAETKEAITVAARERKEQARDEGGGAGKMRSIHESTGVLRGVRGEFMIENYECLGLRKLERNMHLLHSERQR